MDKQLLNEIKYAKHEEDHSIDIVVTALLNGIGCIQRDIWKVFCCNNNNNNCTTFYRQTDQVNVYITAFIWQQCETF